MLKPDKDDTRERKLHIKISYENWCKQFKKLQQKWTNWIQHYIRRIIKSSNKNEQIKFSSILEGLYTMLKWDLFLEHKDGSIYENPWNASYNLAITLLNIYLRELVSGTWTDIYASMFITALFTIAKTWKQPKCSQVEEWINKMWFKQACFLLLYFALLCFIYTALFANWRFMATLCQASLSVPFFQ